VLLPDLCRRWGTPAEVRVAMGCGDNYAGALGVGAAAAGDAALSIGTSGVLSAVDGTFHPAPESAVLTTPHAAPDTYLSMGVVMSATQSLDWVAELTGTAAETLAAEAQLRVAARGLAGFPLARPSLTGVRTPDNRPDAGAVFSSLSAVTDKVDLAYAVMEGVAFQFYDAARAQSAAGVPIARITAVGGGARSALWLELIASLLEVPLEVPRHGDISACLGAAKLAQAAVEPEALGEILGRRQPQQTVAEPVAEWSEVLRARHARYRELPFHGV
ncbi:MAG: FGGY-family carbohydrate kinase, partial [Pseudomonadota bacterium]